MSEILARVWADFVGRIDGPLHFRLIVQPLVACVLAVRGGLRDARQRKPPFLWALAFDPGHRRDLAREGWKDIGTVFVVGVVLDVIYQLVALRWVYPAEAVLAAILLVLVPYLLVRGPVTRLARKD
jgi:hypothetical protein